MKKILSVSAALFVGIFLVSNFVLAEPCVPVPDNHYCDFGTTVTVGESNLPTTNADAPSLIGQIIGAILAMVGVLFFVLMIYGGITWMLARGNEEEVKKAKSLIVNAVIGLAIVLAAYALTGFIGQVVAG